MATNGSVYALSDEGMDTEQRGCESRKRSPNGLGAGPLAPRQEILPLVKNDDKARSDGCACVYVYLTVA